MPVITLAEVKGFLSITDTVQDSAISAMIPEVEARLPMICNRAFTAQPLRPYGYSAGGWNYYSARDSDLYILDQVSATFATSGTVTAKDSNFASAGFAAGQDIFVQASYLNDGYFEVDSVSTSTLTIVSTMSFVAEATGANIYFAVVSWPDGIKPLVANLINYDIQDRPWESSEEQSFGIFGYPRDLLATLDGFTIPRFR